MKCEVRRRRRLSMEQQQQAADDPPPPPPQSFFRSVKQLRQNYEAMLEQTAARPTADDEEDEEEEEDLRYLLLPPPSSTSGYCSSVTTSDEERGGGGGNPHWRRCGSSDSAVGHTDDDEEPGGGRGVPSRTIVAAKDEEQQVAYRCWRTPSVVVSDYSDDAEFFRCAGTGGAQRECSSPDDSSLHSYCSSTISCLDGGGGAFRQFQRRNSDCSSMCSAFSGDEDNATLSDCELAPAHQQPPKPSGWRKLRNIVQWTPFFQTNKKQRYPWVQLAGHQGNFKAGPDQGTILKKLCEREMKCFKLLMKDLLRPYVPEFKGLIASDESECSFLQLQDLLGDFDSPCVMDCKIGVRTYLEEELAKAKEKPKLRKDMYEKMCQIDKDAPTEEEHRLKGVTKPRYMVWRETISSTETLGFRIEGIRRSEGSSSKDFKTTKSRESVRNAFVDFTREYPHAVPKFVQRLKAIRATLEASPFFSKHEFIGSSLLFVHDHSNANVWMIDFAKTVRLPEGLRIDHVSKWKVGNHEDGYLIGLDNIISIFVSILEQQQQQQQPRLLADDDNANNNYDVMN